MELNLRLYKNFRYGNTYDDENEDEAEYDTYDDDDSDYDPKHDDGY
jgi:hypothetical protein